MSKLKVKTYVSQPLFSQTHITELLMSPSVSVREQLCRLLNAFSSLTSGRTYLAQSTGLVTALCRQLVEVSGEREREREGKREGEREGEGKGERKGGVEGNIVRNALGAVQKLSLRYVHVYI